MIKLFMPLSARLTTLHGLVPTLLDANTKTNKSQYIYLDHNTGIVNLSKNKTGVLVISREDETDRIMSTEEVSVDVLN
ncbi:hypothetical protein D0Z62_09550 [Providencia rettgeri]|nr:hypothetical protein RB151_036970 [Providencia rettgeri]RXN71346.1 hypothetical protein D0Z62_09550 [Providencia rettgeri]